MRADMNVTHILIDFENVQPEVEDLRVVRGSNCRIHIFHGAHQKKFDAQVVKELQPLGTNVDYIQCDRKGSNALDFRIAFALGGLVQAAAMGSPAKARPAFIVVSKDKDLDTILAYLEDLGYTARRGMTIREALGLEETAPATPVPKAAASPPGKPAAMTPGTMPATDSRKTGKAPTAIPVPRSPDASDSWDRVLNHLRDHPNNRPATVLALERHLKTVMGKETPEMTLKGLSARLQKEGIAVLVGKKLEYKLP